MNAPAPSVTRRAHACRLLTYARPYVWLIALALTLILASTLVLNALPMLLQRAIDRYLVDGAGTIPERFHGLLNMGGIYLALSVFGFLLRLAQGLLTAWVGQSIVHDLRRDVFAKALSLGLPYYDQTPVGKIMTRVTSDVEAVQRFVTEGVVGLAADGFMLLGIAGYMVWLNPRLAGMTAVMLPGLFAGLEFVNRRLRRANRTIRSRQSDVNSCLQESLAGMSTIQLFNREPYAQRRFDQQNLGLRDAHMTEVRWFSHYFPLIEIGNNGAVALLVGTGGWLVLGGGDGLTVGMLVAFLAYVRNFFWPLADLSNKAVAYQQAMAAAERIFSLFDMPEDIPDPDDPLDPAQLRGEICFEHVTFGYNPEEPVLRDFCLTVRQGESLAVVGATGAGKTTIMNLLTRFYDAQQGRITVGGHDLRRFRKKDLRRSIGLVLQEPFVFTGTIADNIGLGRPDLDRSQLESAALHVHANAFIEQRPGGFDAEPGVLGDGLSAGEKQLLAMARVLAQQPALALVLDEATANIDTRTEWLVQKAMQTLMRERTSIVIAHRLSTIRDADRILVMRQGRIAAQGTHRELMQNDAYYRHLVALLRIDDAESTSKTV